MLPDRYRSSVRIQCCKLLAIKGVFHWLNAQYDMSLLVRITLTAIGIAHSCFLWFRRSTPNVASFPGHSQILFVAVEKNWGKIFLPIFLHSCELKSGSGLGMSITWLSHRSPT